MAEPRSNIIGIVVGNRSRGKTSFVKDEIMFNSTMPKTLIVDTFDNPPWRNLGSHLHPELSRVTINPIVPNQIPSWNNGIYRVFGDKSTRGTIMEIINEHLFNALLVMEDATKYVGSKLQGPMKEFLIDTKQKNLDAWLIFHSLAAVPPELVRIADVLVIFPTADGKLSLDKYPFPDIQRVVDHFRAEIEKEMSDYYEEFKEVKKNLDYRPPITLRLN